MFFDALWALIAWGGGLWSFVTLVIVGPVDLGVIVWVVYRKINPLLPDLTAEEQEGFRNWIKSEGRVEAEKTRRGLYGKRE